MSLMRSEIQDVNLSASSITLSDSAFGSPSSSLLSEPPIPESSTYLSRQNSPTLSPQITPQPSPPVPRQVPPSESWNYDNFIEQPRAFPTSYAKQTVTTHEAASPITNRHNNAPQDHYNPQYHLPQQTQQAQQQQPQQVQYQPQTQPRPQPPDAFYVAEEDLEMSSGRHIAAEQFTSIGFAPPLLASLSYFFLWFGGLVIMLLEKKNLFVLFHAWQSLVSGSIAFVIQFIFIWSNTMYSLLWLVYLLFTFGMIVRVLNDAPSQRLFKLPYIGTWCEHRAINKIHYHSGTGNFYRL